MVICVLKQILHPKKAVFIQLLESSIPPLILLLPSGSSFAKGRPLRMTICKRLVPLDDHFQESGPSGWSLARGRPTPDDHLQEAGPLRMTICKRLFPPDHHLQEAGPHFDNHEKGLKMHCWDPSQWDKICYSVKESNFNEKKGSIFTQLQGLP